MNSDLNSSPKPAPGAGPDNLQFHQWQYERMELDVEEAREAYVGRAYEKSFAASFTLFDEEESFKFTFHWPALLLSWFWFLSRRIYPEGFCIFMCWYVMDHLFELFNVPMAPLLALFLAGLFSALTGKWFYWRKVDKTIDATIDNFEGDTFKTLSSLKYSGGVNWGVVWVCGFIFAWVLWVKLILFFGGLFGMAVVQAGAGA